MVGVSAGVWPACQHAYMETGGGGIGAAGGWPASLSWLDVRGWWPLAACLTCAARGFSACRLIFVCVRYALNWGACEVRRCSQRGGAHGLTRASGTGAPGEVVEGLYPLAFDREPLRLRGGGGAGEPAAAGPGARRQDVVEPFGGRASGEAAEREPDRPAGGGGEPPTAAGRYERRALPRAGAEATPKRGPLTLLIHSLQERDGGIDMVRLDPLPPDAVALFPVATPWDPLLYTSTCGCIAAGRRAANVTKNTATSVAARVYRAMRRREPECDLILVAEERGGGKVVAAPTALQPRTADVARTPARRKALLAAGKLFGWLSLAALMGTPAADFAMATTRVCLAFVRPVHELSTFDEAARIGRAVFKHGGRELQGLVIRPPGADTGTAFRDLQLDICRLSERALRKVLDVPGDQPIDCDKRAWSDRIQPAPFNEVPPELLDKLPSPDHSWLADRAFAAPLEAVSTPGQSPSPPQRCAPAPPNARLRDLLIPGCWSNYTRCRAEHLRDLLDINSTRMAKRRRPKGSTANTVLGRIGS